MKVTNVVMLLSLKVPLVLGFVRGRHHLNRSLASTSTTSTTSTTTTKGTTAATPTTTRTVLQQSNNPFVSMIGDMAGSMFGNSNSLDPNPKVDEAVGSLNIESWDSIRSKLESQQTPAERRFREDLPYGYGIGSPMHKLRLYSKENSEADVRVTFYRDSASWCPYCQKVWLTLEEKKIPYKIEKINMRCYGEKPASFTKIQPGGQIPVAIIDGRTYGQSNDILSALEEAFPDHKSLKPDPSDTSKAQQYFRLERQIFSTWMYWLTTNGGERAKGEFIDTLKTVERALKASNGPFFMGKDITQVDVQFAPFLERMCASLLFYKGFKMRVPKGETTSYPALNAWFDAMETLPAYQLTKSDYYTHCWDLPPQLGGCTYEPDGAAFEKAINGERSIDGERGSWELPLQPHNGGVEPDWDWATPDEGSAKREAVERLSANFEAIVQFAARGAGKKGMPPYTAQLSDPNAVSNGAVMSSVDTALRVVCCSMLKDCSSYESDMVNLAQAISEQGGSQAVDGVVASLAYLRDRVGVPRDMQLPAARQLRAHINWSIGFLLNAKD